MAALGNSELTAACHNMPASCNTVTRSVHAMSGKALEARGYNILENNEGIKRASCLVSITRHQHCSVTAFLLVTWGSGIFRTGLILLAGTTKLS
jgi:hypothetical protein